MVQTHNFRGGSADVNAKNGLHSASSRDAPVPGGGGHNIPFIMGHGRENVNWDSC